MYRKSEIIFFLLPVVADAIFIFVSFCLSYWLRFYSALFPVEKGIPSITPYFLIALFTLSVWIIIFYLSGIYNTKQVTSIFDEIYEVLKDIILGTLIVLAPIFFYRGFTFSRIAILFACLFSGVLIITGKIFIRSLKIYLAHKGIGVKKTCIVGSGERALEVIEKFKKNPVIRYKLVGQITKKGEDPIPGLPMLGNIIDVQTIIQENKIDMLIITFPLSHYKETAKILLRCSGIPVELRFVPDPYELLTSRIRYYDLNGFALLGIREFPLNYWDILLKRVFDIIASSLFILAFLPAGIIIAILIKLSSPGPVFYRQKRVGKDGKLFDIIKFRSMVRNAEKNTGPIFATGTTDSRVTKVGRNIRRWSLDELPQFINVFIGNMSLVGPRPERPEFVEKFSEEINRYFERHKLRPGLTGWAQINGLRGNTSIKERVKYDLYYIENWSFNFDIKILLKTFVASMKGDNAY
ncbi:MAG: undecaprenyl-phosphate glucose phosphotransferase [bacterium]|nr:undecaprenyl-phosphate glucose phosphotransferase [bacterium]